MHFDKPISSSTAVSPIIEDAIKNINKLNDNTSTPGDADKCKCTIDNSKVQSAMKKVKCEQHVKHSNNDSLNTAVANAISNDK